MEIGGDCMSKKNISRCTIDATEKDTSLFVRIQNSNTTQARQFDIQVYKKNAPTELLPVTPNSNDGSNLEPGATKVYSIDTSNASGKLIFEIIQYSGGSGIKVSKSSNRKYSLDIRLK